MSLPLMQPPTLEERTHFDLVSKSGHQDLVQAVAYNGRGDRLATGSVDGKIRVFNRHKDGIWRLCDTWTAHNGEVLELQWLPPTVHPDLLASLGIEGRFKLWPEDASAPPGRRFRNRAKEGPQAAFDHRSSRSPFRSFSMKYNDETRYTNLALLSADGRIVVYENRTSENLSDYAEIDEWNVCAKPAMGEEVSFRVRFDPNPEPCFTALRAGMLPDTLSLVVAAMDTVKVYRSREVIKQSYGLAGTARQFYEAAEISGHRGLVRDVAWAVGNYRGYDIIATACSDGYVRVVQLDTPYDENDGKSWSVKDVAKSGSQSASKTQPQATSSAIGNALATSTADGNRRASGLPGQIKHVVTELSKLDNDRTPVWRVGFDDDGVILGSAGDDGKLHCYRQAPSGQWLKSTEMDIHRMQMTVPP